MIEIAPPTETENLRSRASQAIRQLIHYIDDNIDRGVWEVGTQLPTERELERTLDVSRNTIRRGLQQLARSGRIVREVGRGSFVADPGAKLETVPGLGERIRGASPSDVMEARLILEPSMAALAAQRATLNELETMEHCLAQSEQATSLREFERWDGALHLAIMTASKNSLIADLLRAVNEVRAQPQWETLKDRSVTPERRALYKEQHRGIVRALRDRDPERAASEIRRHLQAVRSHMLGNEFD
jgi:GntR family transcriptional regulator, transcriptional repressor for pyruvate dehydrogenase complex